MKAKPWPLDRLLAQNRNAGTVYLVLRWLAEDRRQLNTTRKTIRVVCGLCEKRISSAMTTLGKAGWVTVRYGRKGNRKWYRLTLPRDTFPIGPKAPHSAGVVRAEKAPQRSERYRAEKALPLLEERGRMVRAEAGPPPLPTTQTLPDDGKPVMSDAEFASMNWLTTGSKP